MNSPDVTSSLTGQDYVGLLIGEVTGKWTPRAARTADGGPERGVAVALPKVTAAVDKQLVVPVNVQGVAKKEVISYEFNLKYDPAVIQPLADVADLKETASRGLSVIGNPTEPGLLRVVVYGALPIDNDGVLLNLRFMAVGSVGRLHHFRLSE